MSKERFRPQMQHKEKPAPAVDRLPKAVRKQLFALGVRSLGEARGMVVFGGK